MTSFQEYLLKRRITKNASGQFTQEARSDPRMATVETWPELRAHLYRKGNAAKISEMLAAAEPVWKGYRAYVLKSRRGD
jgi:hypothetical protein